MSLALSVGGLGPQERWLGASGAPALTRCLATAFAELQTDIHELTNDLDGAGIDLLCHSYSVNSFSTSCEK